MQRCANSCVVTGYFHSYFPHCSGLKRVAVSDPLKHQICPLSLTLCACPLTDIAFGILSFVTYKLEYPSVVPV